MSSARGDRLVATLVGVAQFGQVVGEHSQMQQQLHGGSVVVVAADVAHHGDQTGVPAKVCRSRGARRRERPLPRPRRAVEGIRDLMEPSA
jgi:hypothetical protein